MKKKSDPIKIEIITHFPTDDPDCDGEYYDVEVKMNRVVAAEFGNYCDDKGQDRAEGFMACIKHLFKPKGYFLEEKSVADREPC